MAWQIYALVCVDGGKHFPKFSELLVGDLHNVWAISKHDIREQSVSYAHVRM